MDDFLLQVFAGEIELQCELVLLSAERLDEAFALPQFPTSIRGPSVWLALQGILVSAANISKLLWGSGSQDAPRDELRDALKIDKTSCLYSPDLRNDFEHFDERIERHFETVGSIFIGRNLGLAGGGIVMEGQTIKHFGDYDRSTGIVVFWDHSASVPDIIREVNRILALAHKASESW